SPVTAVLIAVLVPVLAVVTSVVAMRRTVVEPLGVVRRAKPVRRVLWWRLVPVVLGAAALLTQADAFGGTTAAGSAEIIIGGIVLLLLGIPVLLPWVVERAVVRLRGGAPSWQLAIRRLQLESGTAARVVGGVAVILAGGIALQSVMASAETRIEDRPAVEVDRSRLTVSLQGTSPELVERTAGLLARSTGVREVHPLRTVPFKAGPDDYASVTVGTCEALSAQVALPDCREGSAFYVERDSTRGPSPAKPEPGQEVSVYGSSDEVEPSLRWTVPGFTTVPAPDRAPLGSASGLLVTPSLVRDLPADAGNAAVLVAVDPAQPDFVEHVRNAVASLTWRAYVAYFGEVDVSDRVKEFQSIRQALLAGSLVTLLLAGASLLVLALEQVRERRRPLAVLAASGVPRGALARSLLWQNAVPLLLALVVAVAVGGTLAVLLLRIISQPIVLDWQGVGVLSVAAALLVVVVTALTLPSLRRATGALGLRAE
ncbi:MAG: ABC transporter permease, partial [Saccharothrix sp.]|nr:ABC transporter permease [Saccharothrix sp.]